MADPTWAILLAAGESTRMGRLKPLLPWAGTTLIEWQIAQLRQAGCEQVVAVLGSRPAEVRSTIDTPETLIVVNEDYQSGRASSLRTGAETVAASAKRIVILSVDQPRPAWVTSRLIAESASSQAKVVTPRFGTRGGHPLVLDGSLLAELRQVEDATLGLRALTERHREETAGVEFKNPCVIVDLNTPDEYETALAAFNRGEWDRDYAPPLQTG